jgi:hypothetical protein
MARIRSIKPEFWCDATIATFDFFARLFYIAMWNFADDEGRGRAIVRELAGFAFPLDDDLPNAQIEHAVQAIAQSGRIILYNVSGVRHFQIVNWKEHQNINRPTASRFPAPEEHLSAPQPLTDGSWMPQLRLSEPSVSAHEPLTDASSEIGGRRGEVGIRNQELGVRTQEGGCSSEERMQAAPRPPVNGLEAEVLPAKRIPPSPSLKEAVAYCLEIGGTEEQASKFWDHFKTHGWQIRGSPILDWQARLRNWLREDKKDSGKREPPLAGNGHGSSTLADLSKQNEERLRQRHERKAQGECHVPAE